MKITAPRFFFEKKIRKTCDWVCFFILMLPFHTVAQKSSSPEKEIVKKGWNFGALPAVTYNSDQGFQYGGLINLYNYGDGSRYPNYNHSFYFELSRYTKGSSVFRFSYDSDQLLKDIQASADVSYLIDHTYQFYGFNGYDAIYQKDWVDDRQPDYISRVFYAYNRKLFRIKLDLQGTISQSHWKWLAGLNIQNFRTGPVPVDRLNKGKSADDQLPEVDGLYDKYLKWGLISTEEATGGFVPAIKAGIVYDTRDFRPNPGKGIWSAIQLLYASRIAGGSNSFARLSLTHRQYFSLIPHSLILAVRAKWQTRLFGHVPFYYIPQLMTTGMRGSTSEGLGGSKTLRGILQNRIIGQGIILVNAEFRAIIQRFHFHHNNFYIGLDAFTDAGQVTRKVKLNLDQIPFSSTENRNDYFKQGAEKLHLSYGLGLKGVMNENFIVRLDYGIATDSQDGTSGIYMGLHYLF